MGVLRFAMLSIYQKINPSILSGAIHYFELTQQTGIILV